MNIPFDYKYIFEKIPAIIIVLLPDAPTFTIIAASDKVLKLSVFNSDEAIGKSIFIAYPDNPEDIKNAGSVKLRASLEKVVQTKEIHKMDLTRYDTVDEDGLFTESYWQPINTPIVNDFGEIEFIIHTSENVTDKIVSEKRAKISDDNFKFFISQATAPFSILKGREFVYTFANEANIRLLNNRELVGKRIIDAVPELKNGAFLSLMETVYDTGKPYNAFEVPFDAIFEGDSEPSRRYFNFNYIPYRNIKGDIEGLLVSCNDVTQQVELKWKEQKLLKNKEAYNLFMQAPVGFTLTRGDNHILELINNTGYKLIGKTEDVLGKSILEVFPKTEAEDFIEILNKVKNKGEIISVNESAITLNIDDVKQTKYFNIVYQPYYEEGKIEGVLSISSEVTEQVTGRQSIEELKDRFENMANNLPNLSWIANSDGWIFWYNRRWYEYTGTTPQDMEGWGWKTVHHPDTLPAVLDKWQSSIISGEPFEMVFPLKGADNEYRPFLTRIVPIRNKKSEIIRWIGTNTDITKQIQIEKMKENFLSMASHEIRTPVTTIKAYAQLLELAVKEMPESSVLSMVTKINSQADKLTNLVSDLLDVTRIQKGKIKYNYQVIEFCEVIKEVTDDLDKIIITHEIINTCENSFYVFADRDKISQVINNLITNAVKYSPNANKIILTTELLNNGVLFSVQDFGIGINEIDRNHIFEQFYRVTGDNQSTFPGMGIGLYISYEIISRHSGKIWVESEVGEGSKFFVWLPSEEK